jgi:glycosyltransferase involved in cell wall biosynthesis
MMNRVCVIIPAFNEEKTIQDVIRVVQSSPVVHEIIVVSDGSTDATSVRAQETGVTVFERKRQHGKGQALLYGLTKTDAEILLFLDADLLGLTTDHIEQIVSPVLSGARVMNVGIRNRGRLYLWLARHLPLISGERSLRREVIEAIAPEFLHGFMVETALNYCCRINQLPYGSVVLKDLRIVTKYQKVGLFKGVIQYISMAFEILQAHLAIRIANLLGKF